MNKSLFKKFVGWVLDSQGRPDSLANKMRKKRFVLFKSLVEGLPHPIKILDAGGTQAFWSMMEMTDEKDVQIVLFNITEVPSTCKNFSSVVGDATDAHQFPDKAFDVVFSNSVIEHVGAFSDQQRMANEVRRLGERYFIQTPNRNFPIEPHFFFPFFQFLPLPIKVWLATHFDLGSFPKSPNKQSAIEAVNSIRLLTEKELKVLFPHASLTKEKFLGLTKSFIMYEGW
jgi:hypothetical protein